MAHVYLRGDQASKSTALTRCPTDRGKKEGSGYWRERPMLSRTALLAGENKVTGIN